VIFSFGKKLPPSPPAKRSYTCSTMKKVSLIALVTAITAITITGFAFEPPQNSEVLIDESFDEAELGKGWSVQTGAWTVTDGVLHAAEIPADKHAAAARRLVETGNAVYQFKFRLTGDIKAFHFGFDPKRGELDKKGHLFSVVIEPGKWKILKHVDKNRPKEDPNEVLASADHTFAPNQWFTLRVSTWDTSVKAAIETEAGDAAVPAPLSAEHPTFNVRKPTLVFRAVGDGVDIDDVKVWVPKG